MEVDERTLMITCKLAALGGYAVECYKTGSMVEKKDDLIAIFKEILRDTDADDHRKVVAFCARCVKAAGQHPEGSEEAEIVERLIARDEE